MTFKEKLSILTTLLIEKAQELNLEPYEWQERFSIQSMPIIEINVSFTDAELLKSQHHNESKQ